MRIARVLTRLNFGGPARQVLASDPLLLDRGHEVTVFAGSPEPGEGDLFDQLAERGVPVRRVPGLVRGLSPAKDLYALRWLRRELALLAPDVVHTHASKAGTLGRRAAAPLARRGTALVHTFHGHVLEGYFPDVISRRLVAAERRLARTTDRVLAVSHATAEDLLRLEVVDEDRLWVVPPGVDLARHLELPLPGKRGGQGPLRRLLGVPVDAPLVGVVGRLAEVKRPELALEAFTTIAARYPGAHLAFVGDGDFAGGVEEDLVLHDFLHDDFHLVFRRQFYQRSSAPVQSYKTLLDQSRQLESATDLVDDFFFFELFNHSVPPPSL